MSFLGALLGKREDGISEAKRRSEEARSELNDKIDKARERGATVSLSRAMLERIEVSQDG